MSVLDIYSNTEGLDIAPYKPARFGEVVQSSMYNFGQRTGFEITPILETAQDYSDRDNTLKQRFAADDLQKITGTDEELRSEALRIDAEKGLPFSQGYTPDISAVKNQKLDNAILAGRDQDPVKWQGIKTTEELQEEKRNRARAARESFEEISSRATPATAITGSLIGALGAAFTDPINIATLPFGATSSMGILKAMKTEALLNAAVEAAEVPLVASWQKELGYKYGVGDAALDIGTAGVGGAALTGIIRGARPAVEAIGRGFDSAKKYTGSKSQPILQKISDSEKLPSSVREAAKYMSRVSHIDENNPMAGRVVNDGIETRTQAQDTVLHRQTLQDTQDAFKNYEQPIYDEGLESDIAIRSSADLYNQLEQTRIEFNKLEKPKSLLQFLKESGGIKEEGGELKYLDIKSKNYPGLIRNNGKSFDYAAESAWEAGYFADRPTIADFIEAIREDFTNKNVFSDDTLELNLKRQDLSDFIDQTERYFDEKGIDLSKKDVIKQLRLKAKLEKLQRVSLQSSSNNIEKDLIFRPNDALASIQRDVEAIESLNTGDTFKANFERFLKDNPDLEIETEAGRLTLREIKDQIDEDETILSAIRTCAIGKK